MFLTCLLQPTAKCVLQHQIWNWKVPQCPCHNTLELGLRRQRSTNCKTTFFVLSASVCSMYEIIRARTPNKLESQPPTRMNCLKHGNMSGALRAPLGSFVSQLLAQWLAQECTIKFAQIFVDSSLPRILMTPLAAKPRHMAKRADFEPIWCIFPIKIFWITQTINFPMVSSACPAKVSS